VTNTSPTNITTKKIATSLDRMTETIDHELPGGSRRVGEGSGVDTRAKVL
jgi:IS30 family transposase